MMKSKLFVLKMTFMPLLISSTVAAQNRPGEMPEIKRPPTIELAAKASPLQLQTQAVTLQQEPKQDLKQELKQQDRKIIKSRLAVGTGSSGGGDAIERSAMPFKNKELLKKAVQLALTTVNQSELPKNDKENFAQEINLLYNQDLFQEVSSLLISQDYLNSWNPLLGYKAPEGDGQFLDLACITKFISGSKIICSSLRISNYNEDELAATLLHEVLHHILPAVLSADEDFVEDLGNSIVENKINKAIHYALKHKIYIRKGNIRSDQFFANFDLVMKTAGKDFNIADMCGNKSWTPNDLINYVKWRLPKNISSTGVGLIPYLIEDFLNTKSRCINFKLMLKTPIILSNMKLEALGVDVSKVYFLKDHVNTFTWGCKNLKKGNLFYSDSCDTNGEIKFEDILLPLVEDEVR